MTSIKVKLTGQAPTGACLAHPLAIPGTAGPSPIVEIYDVDDGTEPADVCRQYCKCIFGPLRPWRVAWATIKHARQGDWIRPQ